MTKPSHRDRVLAALRHEEPDRVPLDLGSTNASKISHRAYQDLRSALGLAPARPAAKDADVHRRHYLLAGEMVVPDEEVLRLLDVDFRSISLGAPDSAQIVVVSDERFTDEWGVVWGRVGGGEFMNRDGPFQGLDEPTPRDLERHVWPDADDPGRFRALREQALRIREDTDYALVLDLDVGVVNKCQRVRGFTAWLEDLLLHPDFAEELAARVADVEARIVRRAVEEVGDLVDVVVFYDDLGFQDRCYMHPDLYRRRVKPHHRVLVEAIRSGTDATVLLHSDGSLRELLRDLVEIGIDAINPVQTTAAGMDSRELKAEFGAELSFWGAVDTQRVLPFGTESEVVHEVERRIADLGPGGGFVLAACHNIQADVPGENVLAMFNAAKRLRYPKPGPVRG